MPPHDASDELPSSPVPPGVHDRVTSRLAEDDATETGAAAFPRCPRCGGRAEPRRRAPSRLNPFLRSAPPPGQITCEDCGLDFEHPADASKAPWSARSAKDS